MLTAALLSGSLLASPVAGATGSEDLGSSGSAGSSAAAESVTEVPELPGPPQPTHAAATVYDGRHPGSAPPGSNDFGCVPTAAHPKPVILAHGTDATAYSDWSAISPQLKSAGYCVFAVNYGGKPGGARFGTQDMHVSAGQVADFVQRVRTATGAAKVDLVGFSQGATVTRMFVNKMGGAAVVDRWVGVASPSYGGQFYGVAPVAAAIPGGMAVISSVLGQAVAQQVQGSELLTELNAGGDTVPGVSYTTIGTRYDEMIQPYTNVELHGAGAKNVLIQDLCAQDKTGHMNMVYDPFTISLVVGALDPERAPAPLCVPVPLGTGMVEMMIASNFGV